MASSDSSWESTPKKKEKKSHYKPKALVWMTPRIKMICRRRWHGFTLRWWKEMHRSNQDVQWQRSSANVPGEQERRKQRRFPQYYFCVPYYIEKGRATVSVIGCAPRNAYWTRNNWAIDSIYQRDGGEAELNLIRYVWEWDTSRNNTWRFKCNFPGHQLTTSSTCWPLSLTSARGVSGCWLMTCWATVPPRACQRVLERLARAGSLQGYLVSAPECLHLC